MPSLAPVLPPPAPLPHGLPSVLPGAGPEDQADTWTVVGVVWGPGGTLLPSSVLVLIL